MDAVNRSSGIHLRNPCPSSPSPSMPFTTTHLTAISATSSLFQHTDGPTLKRAFSTSASAPNSSFPCKKLEQSFSHTCNRPSSSPSEQRRPSSTIRRSPSLASFPRSRRLSMVQTSAQSYMPMPSFAAVFGGATQNIEIQDHADVNGSNVARPASSGNNTITGAPFSSFHMHHDSRESNSTGSSDNSPTTTISTMDSSSVTDPSPASPESPLAKTAAASSFVADFRSRRPDTSSSDSSPSAFFELQRPTTPAKKPRNLKNLGINTATSLTNLRAHTPAPIAVVPKERVSSAPPSPLFIKPPTPPKRRPSNLSLTISPPGTLENKPVRLIIPSTPSFNRPALRHFQSSPSLPLCSPSTNPFGGMQLPSLRPLNTKTSGLSEVPFEMEEEEEDQEPNFDVPQSREEKPAAYPNGPICIYEAGVYLYFEPTAEQAMTFDCIVNVASEVKNPFTSAPNNSQKNLDARRVDGPPAESVDFASLSQSAKNGSLAKQDSSPTTPKAAPLINISPPHDFTIDGKTYRTPEYIHVPWEHNTDIVPDLHKLVKMMDDKVQLGKRVLVHCQCGVSRSASLIVAYGLFKNPTVSVQEAYDSAKKRSRWIGPNMNLIMQLQEFRNGLLRQQNENRGYLNSGFGRRSAGLPSARANGAGRFSAFDMKSPAGPRTPQTAPLPPDSDISLQRASTGNMIAISPGPLSAPTGSFDPGFRRSWDASETHFDLPPQSAQSADAFPKDQIIPTVSISNLASPSTQPEMTLPPLVPNFSRQLPLRSLDNASDAFLLPSKEAHLGASQSLGFEALKSPAMASFNIPPRPNQSQTVESDILSPTKSSFNLNPWPKGYDQDANNELSGLTSPRNATFDLTASTNGQHAEMPELASPVATQFPRDVFGSSNRDLVHDPKSPRSSEFHMTPLKPRTNDVDPFGLTSPTRAEFAGPSFNQPFSTAHRAAEGNRRVPFQAILPPSHQTFSGFASLDGTAKTQPTPQSVTSITANLKQPTAGAGSRTHNSNLQSKAESIKPSVPAAQKSLANFGLPRIPNSLNLPPASKGMKTRFSSPNLRETRRLHQLQTEIQSKLSTSAHPATDDMDTLMSPRAEEFTRNPFHIEPTPGDDVSPASSDETIRDERSGHDWKTPVPSSWTAEKAVDPRSPVQTGSNPIVRNILDVL